MSDRDILTELSEVFRAREQDLRVQVLKVSHQQTHSVIAAPVVEFLAGEFGAIAKTIERLVSKDEPDEVTAGGPDGQDHPPQAGEDGGPATPP